MIGLLRGKIVKRSKEKITLLIQDVGYEIYVPPAVLFHFNNRESEEPIEIVIYQYLAIDKNRAIPVMIGFCEELERDFFELFIRVSGIGPRAAIKAFNKPISLIAQAIEEANLEFLRSLPGIGNQKARQIIAQLQGKVGRFALMKAQKVSREGEKKDMIEETRQILKRLQYHPREIESMIKNALKLSPEIVTSEDLLNEIYRQKK